MKVSAQSGAFRSSISLMSLYWELQALSAESMASIFSTATVHTEKDLCQLLIKLGDDENSLVLHMQAIVWNEILRATATAKNSQM